MRRSAFLSVVIVLGSVATICVRAIAASTKPLTVTVQLPVATQVTGILEFDVTLERWGPPPASQPAGFVRDGVIGDECVKLLQKDRAYQQAIAKEKRTEAVAATLGADGRWVPKAIGPGLYSLYVQAFDKQPGERGRPMISRHLWIISISSDDKPVDLGTLALPGGKHLGVGHAAPAISGAQLNGREFEASPLRGNWYIVSFWATWCPACLDELPQVANLQKSFPDVLAVGMCFDEDFAKGQAYCVSKGYGWPNMRLGAMESSPVPKEWGISVLPQLFLIDPSGKVAAASASPGQLRIMLEKR